MSEVDLPHSLVGVSVGDFVRADIVRKLTVEQIKGFALAVHQRRLPIDEGERGLAVLVSPLKRFNRRNPSACELSFACASEAHVDSASINITEAFDAPDVVFIPEEDDPAGWHFWLAGVGD